MILNRQMLLKHIPLLLILLFSQAFTSNVYAAILEAEKATITGAKTKTINNASGQRYIDYTAAKQSITFTTNVATAGTYTLRITEANGRGWKTGVDIYINNKYAMTHWLSPTGGWTKWTTKTLKVKLGAGNNKIKLIAKYDHSQNIDKISLPTAATAATAATATVNAGSQNQSQTASGNRIIEAESASISGAAKQTSSNASNNKYIDFSAAGQFIEFNYSAATAGNYSLKITEANGRSQNTGVEVLVNGKLTTTEWLKPTGGWTRWVTEQVNLLLKAGNNKIRLRAKYDHSQNIDKILVSAVNNIQPKTTTKTSATGTGNNSSKYEAESANIFGAATRNGGGASNQKYVDFTAPNQSVVFDINAAAAGKYSLGITEASGHSWKTGMDIFVNGKLVVTDWIKPGSGWTNWTTNTFNINLKTGSNRIKFKSRYDHSQNIDRISISGVGSTSTNTTTATNNAAAGQIANTTSTTNTTTARSTTSGTGKMRLGTNLNFQNPNADSNEYNGVSAFKDNINWSTTTNPWNNQFLSDISIYSAIRFMNWSGTNGSTETNWNNRVKKTDYGQDQHWDGIKPVAWEWMIDLSNRTGADLWINLPHRIVNRNSGKSGNLPNDYVRKLAILIKYGVDMQNINLSSLVNGNYSALAGKSKQWFLDNGGINTGPALDPSLKVYVEYSNEIWNYSIHFSQTLWAGNEGLAMGIPFKQNNQPDYKNIELVNKFSAYAHTLIWNSFKDIYGSNSKVKKVLGHHQGGLYFMKRKYEIFNDASWNPKNIKPDYVAVGTYFGNNLNGSNGSFWQQLQTDIDKIVKVTKEFKAEVLNLYGVKTISYEGGQHVTKNCAAVNRSNEMYEKYRNYLNNISGSLDLFMHYTQAGGYVDNVNCWGAMERIGQTNAPKYRALKEFVQ